MDRPDRPVAVILKDSILSQPVAVLYESLYNILNYFHFFLQAVLEDNRPRRPVAVIMKNPIYEGNFMRRIYISFLGNGIYNEATYCINGKKAEPYIYVQAAELQLAGTDYFDKIFLVMTRTSKNKHYDILKKDLSRLGIDDKKISSIEITEELDPDAQWSWFEEILTNIDPGDELTVDLTHGYRIFSIVFSTALNFLQKAKDIKIKAVYYGAYEKDKKESPIVDVKDFYIINQWTDAISRLVEDADPGKLGVVAQEEENGRLNELNDPELIEAFQLLTGALKNVEVHKTFEKASNTIELIKKKERNASITGKILFDLVKEKFVSLISDKTSTGRYDYDYFRIQLTIIELLLQHHLFMQAYTVMREMAASFGLIQMPANVKIQNAKGRDKRKYAEVFISMLVIDEEKWTFEGYRENIQKNLLPLYNSMKQNSILPKLREIVKDLVTYRNGFDHAWTSQAQAKTDIEEKGAEFLKGLEEVVEKIQEKGMYGGPPEKRN